MKKALILVLLAASCAAPKATPAPEPTPFRPVTTKVMDDAARMPTPTAAPGLPMPNTVQGIVIRGRYANNPDGSRAYMLTVAADNGQGVKVSREVAVPTQEEWATMMLTKRACVANPGWFDGTGLTLFLCQGAP